MEIPVVIVVFGAKLLYHCIKIVDYLHCCVVSFYLFSLLLSLFHTAFVYYYCSSCIFFHLILKHLQAEYMFLQN